jgi:hypothetical protein
MILQEAGVHYTRDCYEAADLGLLYFDYDTYKENEYVTREEVFCNSRADFLKLVAHWNRFGFNNPFHYYPVT